MAKSVTAPVKVARSENVRGESSRTGSAPPKVVRGPAAGKLPWVALAVLLVLGGALLNASRTAEERQPVLAAARPLVAGQVIAQGDLRVVTVSVEGGAQVVPSSELDRLVGQMAVMSVPEGALLAPAQVAADGGLAADERVVGALLGPGEVPVPLLRAGDRVELLAVSTSAGAEPGESLGSATVFSVAPGTQPGLTFVSLVVTEDRAQRVSEAVAAKQLRMVLLPAGG